ncbi:MAG: hypothetical protein AVDCRST_MAG04-277, partial [uncultured Acetobacteraceae bacterium]
ERVRRPPRGGPPVPPRVRALHPRGELAHRQRRHGLRAGRPLPDPGGARPARALRRADGRAGAGAARHGATPPRPRLGRRGRAGRRRAVRPAGAARAGGRLGRRVPGRRGRGPRGLHAVAAARARRGRGAERRGGVGAGQPGVPAAGLRQPRLLRGAGGREALDGARVPAARGLAAAARREARARASL